MTEQRKPPKDGYDIYACHAHRVRYRLVDGRPVAQPCPECGETEIKEDSTE